MAIHMEFLLATPFTIKWPDFENEHQNTAAAVDITNSRKIFVNVYLKII